MLKRDARLGGYRRLSALAGVLSLLSGCQADVGGATPATEVPAVGGATSTGGLPPGSSTTGAGGSGGGTGIGGDPAELCAASAGVLNVGRTRLRRMTRSQFDNTVRDLLLGSADNPSSALGADESIGPFYSNAIAPVTNLLVQQHDEIAVRLAAEVVPRMNDIAPCSLAADPSGVCPDQFITEFGRKAYRRPLEAVEQQSYRALYELALVQGNVETAFAAVVETMLESPFFLYHVDVGVDGVPLDAPVRLDSYELASRLSYFLWNTMPDEGLFTLAASGGLQDEAVLAAEVDRLLASPRAAETIASFHVQWLGLRDMAGLQKDPARFPQFNADLVSAMQQEIATFSDYVVRQGDGLLGTLFTASYSFIDGGLFDLYGLAQPAGFVPGTRVELNPAQRSGLLTRAAFLATHAHPDQTSPVHRGILVRENVLCQPLNPPPANVDNVPPPVSEATTTRERFAQHSQDPVCGSCHRLTDPIGLVFEHYDPVGAYREMDGPLPVDASGEIVEAGDDVAGPFVGAIELGQRLAQSSRAAECVANQWFRFALGRIESNDDACTVQALHDAFAASSGNVRQLLGDIARSDAFRHVRSAGTSP
jgi:hypothetical protein